MSRFGPLAPLRERPIPDQTEAYARLTGYRDLPLTTTPASDEPLIDCRDYGIAGRNHYAHADNPPYYQAAEGAIEALFLRRGVVEKLVAVNRRLSAAGLELFVFDAWRPKAVQAYFFNVWAPEDIARRNPSLSGEALRREVEKYWSPPTESPAAPAPHSTGGAVDLTARWKDGPHLWMGSIFDDPSSVSQPDHFEPRAASVSDEEARANRRLLYWLMIEVGFVGNPTEWWHFSHGDQMWARLSGAEAAFYDAAAPDAAK